jgi:hypothetical protein
MTGVANRAATRSGALRRWDWYVSSGGSAMCLAPRPDFYHTRREWEGFFGMYR